MKYLAAGLGTFILIELCSRIIYLKIKTHERFRDASEAIEYILSDNEISPNRKFVANPYSLYWNANNRVKGGYKQTDSRGYRNSGDDFTQLPSKETLRILVLGGSTTFSDHHFQNPNETWVAQLEVLTKNFMGPSGQVEVINAGLNYATSAELLSHYIFSAQHLRPEIVIWDGPGNDFLPVALGDETTDYRYTRYSLTFQKRKYENKLLRSGFLKIIYLKWVTSANLIVMEPQNFTLGASPKHQERLENSNADIYALNLKTLATLCEANESPLVLIDFLRPSKSKLQSYYPDVYKGLFKFNESCNSVNSTLSKVFPNVHHIKLSEASIDDSDFIDSCHFNKVGESKKANFVFRNLMQLNLLRRLSHG